MSRPCTRWLDRDAVLKEEVLEEKGLLEEGLSDRGGNWNRHFVECLGCRREYALDQLLAQERINITSGFSVRVMQVIASHNRRLGVAAMVASVVLMVFAGWLLSVDSASGLGGTLLSLFANALTVGWGWLGASWVGLRTVIRPNLSPQTVFGLALMMTAFSILTWRMIGRRAATSKHRSR